MNPGELDTFASEIIFRAGERTQAELRRAVSALYYWLFHELTGEAARYFSGAGTGVLWSQIARAFDHTTMRDVCKAIVDGRDPLKLFGAAKPDEDLVAVATAFIRLPEARHLADYDLSSTFTRHQTVELFFEANQAFTVAAVIADRPEMAAFRAALLLGKRVTHRRG